MKTLTAEDILKAEDRKTELVPVPEWGGQLIIRELSALERDRFDASLRDDNDQLNLTNYRARLVAACACDEDGKPLFQAHQVAALGAKSSVAMNRAFRAAQTLNGMTAEVVAAEKKDSSETPSDASLSA